MYNLKLSKNTNTGVVYDVCYETLRFGQVEVALTDKEAIIEKIEFFSDFKKTADVNEVVTDILNGSNELKQLAREKELTLVAKFKDARAKAFFDNL